MTPIDYKALAKRLEMHAECHANVEPFDDEQRQWAADLRTVVSLLEEMAEAKPVAWMHDGPPLHGEASITPEPDAWHEFSLYAHPAQQPIPKGWQLVPEEPTPMMCEEGANQVIAPISTAARKAAETYRAMLAVAPQPAPQPQPERQPVSEPTDRCKHGVRFPHECRECEAEPSIEKIQRWRESEGVTEREPHPIDPHMIVAEDRFPDEPEPTEAQIEAAERWLNLYMPTKDNRRMQIEIASGVLRAALAAKEQPK